MSTKLAADPFDLVWRGAKLFRFGTGDEQAQDYGDSTNATADDKGQVEPGHEGAVTTRGDRSLQLRRDARNVRCDALGNEGLRGDQLRAERCGNAA